MILSTIPRSARIPKSSVPSPSEMKYGRIHLGRPQVISVAHCVMVIDFPILDSAGHTPAHLLRIPASASSEPPAPSGQRWVTSIVAIVIAPREPPLSGCERKLSHSESEPDSRDGLDGSSRIGRARLARSETQ